MSAALQMFVLYHDPLDYPGKWILRRWLVEPGQDPAAELEPMAVADSREEALASLPIGLYCIGRFKEDEPQIHEVWL